MKFKEAYSIIMSGKRMTKTSFIDQSQNSIKYICAITVKYFLSDDLLKTDLPFIALCDSKDNIQRVSDQSIISFLLSEDDDWLEYIEPIIVPKTDIEDAVVERECSSC